MDESDLPEGAILKFTGGKGKTQLARVTGTDGETTLTFEPLTRWERIKRRFWLMVNWLRFWRK